MKSKAKAKGPKRYKNPRGEMIRALRVIIRNRDSEICGPTFRKYQRAYKLGLRALEDVAEDVVRDVFQDQVSR